MLNMLVPRGEFVIDPGTAILASAGIRGFTDLWGGISGAKAGREKRRQAEDYMNWLSTMPYKKIDILSPEQKQVAGGLTDVLQTGLTTPRQMPDDPLFDQAKVALGQAMAGMTPEQADAFYQQYFAPIAQRTFEQKVLPGVRESYTGLGFWGEPRARGEAEAYQQFGAEELQRIGQLYQSMRGEGLTALGMLPEYMGEERARFMMGLPEYSPAVGAALQFMSEPFYSVITPGTVQF